MPKANGKGGLAVDYHDQTAKIERIFNAKPECGWGLRGDPYLWNLLRGNWSSGTLPNTAEEFKAAIEHFYGQATGMSVYDTGHLAEENGEEGDFIPLFKKVGYGMSAGVVSRTRWRDQYIPLLVRRFKNECEPLMQRNSDKAILPIEGSEPEQVFKVGSLNILAAADLHDGGFMDIDLSYCDMVLLAGDICPERVMGPRLWDWRYEGGYISKLQWLERLFLPWCESHPNVEFVMTLGNRDVFVREKPLDQIAWPKNVHCLIDEEIEIKGLKIYGTPWVQIKDELLKEGLPGKGVFEVTPEELRKKFSSIPSGLDILISHATPAYTDSGIDLAKNRAGEEVRYGSQELTVAIQRTNPKVVLCGHIHSKSHRVARLELGCKSEIVNVSCVMQGDRHGLLGVVPPREILVQCKKNEVSIDLLDRCGFPAVFTRFGKPWESESGNPFEDTDVACHLFWDLEAWLLDPETVDYDKIEKSGRSRLAAGKCSKAITEADVDESFKILAAAMEEVGEKRDERADARDLESDFAIPVPRYCELDWRDFFKGPWIAFAYRFYKGEGENPYDAERDFDKYTFWTFEEALDRNDWLRRLCLHTAFRDRQAILDDPWLAEIKAPLTDKVLAWVGKQYEQRPGMCNSKMADWNHYFKREEFSEKKPEFKFYKDAKKCIWEPGSNEALFWQGEKIISEWTNEHFNDLYYEYADYARQKWCKDEGGAQTTMEAFMAEMTFEIVSRFVPSLVEGDFVDYFKPVTPARRLVALHAALAHKEEESGIQEKGMA